MATDEEIKLIRYVSKYVFTVDGSKKYVFRVVRNKLKGLGDLKGYLQRSGIEIFKNAEFESARDFYERAVEIGYTAENTRKNRFIIAVIDGFYKEYVRREVDLDEASEEQIQEIFSSDFDTTPVERKNADYALLVGDAVSRYKKHEMEPVESYVSYLRKDRDTYERIDKQHNDRGYIPSSFFSNKKYAYLEFYCLERGYRYSKTDVNVWEEECMRCGMEYNSLLHTECPCCGERFFRKIRPLNGKYLPLANSFLEEVGAILSRLMKGQHSEYSKLYAYTDLKKEYVDEYYPISELMKAIGTSVSQEKFKGLESLEKMVPTRAKLLVPDYFRDYEALDPLVKTILDEQGYYARLKEISRKIDGDAQKRTVSGFEKAVIEVEAAQDYGRAKSLLDEYKSFDTATKEKIEKNGLYTRLNNYYLELATKLLGDNLAIIEKLLSRTPSTYKTASRKLTEIETIIESTDLPIETVMAEKGLDRKLSSLRDVCRTLRLKDGTAKIIKSTDELCAEEIYDEAFRDSVAKLIAEVEGLPEDLSDHYLKERGEEYESLMDKYHLISAKLILDSKFASIEEGRNRLSEANRHLKSTSGREEFADIKKQLKSKYRSRSKELEARLVEETVRYYHNLIDSICGRSFDPKLYDDAMNIRKSILLEQPAVEESLIDSGDMEKLNQTIVSSKKEHDSELISSLVSRLKGMSSKKPLTYKYLVDTIRELSELSQDQTSLFDMSYGQSVSRTIEELQKERSVAKDLMKDIEQLVVEDHSKEISDSIRDIDGRLGAVGPLAKKVIESDPLFPKYVLYCESQNRWIIAEDCKALSEIVTKMKTLSSFIKNNPSLVRKYNSLPEWEKKSPEIRLIMADYSRIKKDFQRKQLDNYRALIEKTEGACTKENIDSLCKLERLMIDKKTNEYTKLKVRHDALLFGYQRSEILKNIEKLGKLRGFAGIGLKKRENAEEFIKVFEETRKYSAGVIASLPKKEEKKYDSYRDDYNKLINKRG